jgi:putative FmdB family regulatory protein
MPIFEYQCDDCGTKFEKLVRRLGGEEVMCPSCGESKLTMQFSTFAAHSNGESDGGFDSGPDSGNDEMPSCAGGMCQTPDLCGLN